MGWGQENKTPCNISETVQDGNKVRSRIRAFDWCRNQWPWMTLNGLNVTLADEQIMEPPEKFERR